MRVFRVDNPHTKPVAFWEWVLPEVWADHPDVVFLSEAFTRPAMMHKLAEVGFSQSYTYFTWRDDRLGAARVRRGAGPRARRATTFRPNFWPNTPDILAGPPAPRQPGRVPDPRRRWRRCCRRRGGCTRASSCARTSRRRPTTRSTPTPRSTGSIRRDWKRRDSLAPFVAELNRIRHEHPSCGRLDTTVFHDTEDPDVLAWSKHDPVSGDQLLVVVNLDPVEPRATMLRLDLGAFGLDDGEAYDVTDELTGERWTWLGWHNYVRLDPGERVAHVFRLDRR